MFDWNNFLTLAEQLSSRPDPASKRTAISRAYYFAFNVAMARAIANCGPIRSGEPSHSWCWNRYMESENSSCRKIFLLGDRMKRRRIKADYDNADMPRIEQDVQRALEDARQVRDDLAVLPGTCPSPSA